MNQFDKFKNERSQPFFDLMSMLVPSPNGHVVDLGCGTGELTAELHKPFEAAGTIGIDSSDEMLAFRKRLFERLTDNRPFFIHSTEY